MVPQLLFSQKQSFGNTKSWWGGGTDCGWQLCRLQCVGHLHGGQHWWLKTEGSDLSQTSDGIVCWLRFLKSSAKKYTYVVLANSIWIKYSLIRGMCILESCHCNSKAISLEGVGMIDLISCDTSILSVGASTCYTKASWHKIKPGCWNYVNTVKGT